MMDERAYALVCAIVAIAYLITWIRSSLIGLFRSNHSKRNE